MRNQPQLSFWQIWNLSFGFLGIQLGYSLQVANASRILSNLGAQIETLSFFWLVAPTLGLFLQPLVGAASDTIWTRIGRRSPFILVGAIFAMIAMVLLPNAPLIVKAGGAAVLIFAAVMLAIMDGSFNVTFQPFRALVADMTAENQRNAGYSVQSFLINAGAVAGSLLPYILTVIGFENHAPAGKVAPSVIWSFCIGGLLLLLSVLLTVFKTREYPPAEFNAIKNITDADLAKRENFFRILFSIPKTMWQLAVVQLFSWFPLFMIWIYSTSAIAQHYWGTAIDDTKSEAYNQAGNWVGVCFAAYGISAALFSTVLPTLIRLTSRKIIYSASLILGGIGTISMYFFSNQYLLLLSMLGLGIAWAAILAMPYAILSGWLPPKRTGIYMGLFNLTVIIPQIICGFFGGPILKYFFHSQAIYLLLFAGIIMLVGSLLVYFVNDNISETANTSGIS